jgi:hypothetical protein
MRNSTKKYSYAMFYAELKSPLAFLRLPNDCLCFSLVGSRPCDRPPRTQNTTLAPL